MNKFRTLFVFVLLAGFSSASPGQKTDSRPETGLVVPDNAMEKVTRRVLIWYFKPRTKPKIVFLSEQRIKPSWLPKIRNVEFRLLSDAEIRERMIDVYFFTEPGLIGDVYDIGFAFGDPICGDYSGGNWHFRISRDRLRLWESGGVGGACSFGPNYRTND